jgi:hypothetical protein
MIDFEPVTFSAEPVKPHIPPEQSVPSPFPDEKAVLSQVERILHSEELRGCEVLRRLLKFLADKSISGEADELKEYIVAIDGLGKPPSYDPRHNSAVRIQVGRLRQKLADYYRGEGREDPVVVDVPKGRFKLRCEYRISAIPGSARAVAVSSVHPIMTEPERKRSYKNAFSTLRIATFVLTAAMIAVGAGAYYHWLKPVKANTASTPHRTGWNSDMEDLWRPFIATNRPLIVAIEDPLFVQLDGKKGIYYRDRTLNRWSDIVSSPEVKSMRGVLKNHALEPSRYYTAFGEVDASFLIAKLLGSRVQNLSVVKTSNLSLRELADNNVLFVGVENIFFNDQIQATPIEAPLQPFREGIRDLHPGPNEPALFVDKYSTAPSEEGVAYALITHLPGPMGRNDVESFTSNRAAGYVAAVKAFTDPVFVRTLVGQLKQSSGGRMPRYYQVLLKVKFKDEVPTEITCEIARELR